MTLAKGAIFWKTTDHDVPLAEGETVPCPKCAGRHIVLRDTRPGQRLNTDTGVIEAVRNEALYVECPDAPGPIVVGMDGKALATPLELTPRRRSQ